MKAEDGQSVALFLPHLGFGGVEQTTINLAGGFAAEGYATDLVVAAGSGPLAENVPPNVHLVDFRSRSTMLSLLKLVAYLRRVRPKVLISSKTHANVVALVGNWLAGLPALHIVRECSEFQFESTVGLRDRMYMRMARRLYPRANAIVAVSESVAAACARRVKLPLDRIRVIPDAIVTTALERKLEMPVNHEWMEESTILFMGAGRLVAEKDFVSLIRAFALVHAALPHARLLLLGDGPERSSLEQLVDELELRKAVALAGFVRNVPAFLRGAGAFVLSSRSEGFPGVLIEALFAGCPIVATSCSVSVSQVLGDGEYGSVVPVGDVSVMAAAMLRAVQGPRRSDLLRQRAREYSVDRAMERYEDLLREVGSKRCTAHS